MTLQAYSLTHTFDDFAGPGGRRVHFGLVFGSGAMGQKTEEIEAVQP